MSHLTNPTIGQLRSMVAKWQERLSLRDWTITEVRWATKAEEKEENSATCEPYLTTKVAKLVFIKPLVVRFDPGEDYEYLVVHELMHLHMAPFQTKEKSLEDITEENVVHAMASLLIALDRRDETILQRKLSKRAAIKPFTTTVKKEIINVEVCN